MKDFSWANGTVESVSTFLAEKKAEPVIVPAPNPAIPQPVNANPAMDSAINYGLGGAALGGLLAGSTSLLAPKEKRKTLRDTLTGALAGGLAGGGLGYAMGGGIGNESNVGPFGGGGKKNNIAATKKVIKTYLDSQKLNKQMSDVGGPDGYWESRANHIYNIIPNIKERLGSGDYWGALENTHLPSAGRALVDNKLGTPVGGFFQKGFLPNPLGLPIPPGTFHGDYLTTAVGTDALMSALRRFWYYRDPEYFLHGLEHPEVQKLLGPEKISLIKNYISKLPDDASKVRALSNLDPKTGMPLLDLSGKRYRSSNLVIPHDEVKAPLFTEALKTPVDPRTIPADFKTFRANRVALLKELHGLVKMPPPPSHLKPTIANSNHPDWNIDTADVINAVSKGPNAADIQRKLTSLAANLKSVGADAATINREIRGAAEHMDIHRGYSLANAKRLARITPQEFEQFLNAGETTPGIKSPAFDVQALVRGKQGLRLQSFGKFQSPDQRVLDLARPELRDEVIRFRHIINQPGFSALPPAAISKLRGMKDTELANIINAAKRGESYFPHTEIPYGSVKNIPGFGAKMLSAEPGAVRRFAGGRFGGLTSRVPVTEPFMDTADYFRRYGQKLENFNKKMPSTYTAALPPLPTGVRASWNAAGGYRPGFWPKARSVPGFGWNMARGGARRVTNQLTTLPRPLVWFGPLLANEFVSNMGEPSSRGPVFNRFSPEELNNRISDKATFFNRPGAIAEQDKAFDSIAETLGKEYGISNLKEVAKHISPDEKYDILHAYMTKLTDTPTATITPKEKERLIKLILSKNPIYSGQQ